MNKGETCIVIPTFNEEATIYEVIKGFPKELFDKSIFILVVDGGSTDRTVELAKEAGAQVILQKTKGKGEALREGVKAVSANFYVFIDGDGTYSPDEVDKLLMPVIKDMADMVVGSRFLGEMEEGAMSQINKLGNKIFNFIVRKSIGPNITDMLSGYRAIKGSSLKELVLLSSHFEIEAEITVESFLRKLRIVEVPIKYMKRRGTISKLKPFQDGAKILRSILFFIMNTRPLFFFSIIASLFILLGTYPAAYVFYEKIFLGEVYHFPSVVLSSLLFISGALVFVVGLLAELIVTTRRRLEYALKELTGK